MASTAWILVVETCYSFGYLKCAVSSSNAFLLSFHPSYILWGRGNKVISCHSSDAVVTAMFRWLQWAPSQVVLLAVCTVDFQCCLNWCTQLECMPSFLQRCWCWRCHFYARLLNSEYPPLFGRSQVGSHSANDRQTIGHQNTVNWAVYNAYCRLSSSPVLQNVHIELPSLSPADNLRLFNLSCCRCGFDSVTASSLFQLSDQQLPKIRQR